MRLKTCFNDCVKGPIAGLALTLASMGVDGAAYDGQVPEVRDGDAATYGVLRSDAVAVDADADAVVPSESPSVEPVSDEALAALQQVFESQYNAFQQQSAYFAGQQAFWDENRGRAGVSQMLTRQLDALEGAIQAEYGGLADAYEAYYEALQGRGEDLSFMDSLRSDLDQQLAGFGLQTIADDVEVAAKAPVVEKDFAGKVFRPVDGVALQPPSGAAAAEFAMTPDTTYMSVAEAEGAYNDLYADLLALQGQIGLYQQWVHDVENPRLNEMTQPNVEAMWDGLQAFDGDGMAQAIDDLAQRFQEFSGQGARALDVGYQQQVAMLADKVSGMHGALKDTPPEVLRDKIAANPWAKLEGGAALSIGVDNGGNLQMTGFPSMMDKVQREAIDPALQELDAFNKGTFDDVLGMSEAELIQRMEEAAERIVPVDAVENHTPAPSEFKL